MLKCPRDGTALREQVHKTDVRVDTCPTCGGVWLDRGELHRIEQAHGPIDAQALRGIQSVAAAYELARQKAKPAAACPHCGGELAAKEYAYCSQVLVDACPKCEGVWLDGGEIAALEQFFGEAGAEEATRRGFWASLTGLFPLYRIGKVTARFVRKAGGAPLSGVSGQYTVKLFDKDPLKDDELCEPRLGADGRVECVFDLYDAASADSPLERKPDLYMAVYEGDREVFRTPTFSDLDFRPPREGDAASHDFGTFEV
jgi:Zn-finger nucleic acid-binding protein